MLTPYEEPKRHRNPLFWAVIGAFATFLPPYHFRDFADFLLPGAAVLFLIVYFARSPFAWHVLAANILLITPLYVLLSRSWRLQRLLHPGIIWFPIIATIAFLSLLFWSRARYFAYLEQQKQTESENPI